jgi:heme-degrading monooxygenase HmoA
MYVSIRAYQGNSGLADALVEKESEVRRLIGEIEGFRAYYLLKLSEGTTTVSVFDTQAGAEASNQAAAAWLAENMPEMAATPYVTAGEAVLSF